MSNLIVAENNHAADRPRLYRSDHQLNLLDYIDTTLNESFSLNLTLTRTSSNGFDQLGNTTLDQYLLYLLCQKINPSPSNNLTNALYHLLHELIISNGKISKSFFEYSLSANNFSNNETIFNTYCNFVWNEFDLNVLLELGCFLLKYRLHDIFNMNIGEDLINKKLTQRKMMGYFLEIIGIYYLASNHRDFFVNSRSTDMILPSPVLYSMLYEVYESTTKDSKPIFRRFLDALYDNGEIYFNGQDIKTLLRNDAYRFLNKKMENKKIKFMKFLEFNVLLHQRSSPATLKSICRVCIKMHAKQYPDDIKKLSSSLPLINHHLQSYLVYENKFIVES